MILRTLQNLQHEVYKDHVSPITKGNSNMHLLGC